MNEVSFIVDSELEPPVAVALADRLHVDLAPHARRSVTASCGERATRPRGGVIRAVAIALLTVVLLHLMQHGL